MNLVCNNRRCNLAFVAKNAADVQFKHENRIYCSRECLVESLSYNFLQNRKKIYESASYRRIKLGVLLLRQRIIEKEDLLEALKIKESTKKKTGEILINLGLISHEELYRALSIQAGTAKINLSPDQKVALTDIIPVKLMKKVGFFCFEYFEEEKKISAVTYDPVIINLLEEFLLSLFPKYQIKVYFEEDQVINEILNRNLGLKVFEKSDSEEYQLNSMKETIKRMKHFLNELTGKKIKVDNLGESVWLKTDTEDLSFDIYISRKE